MDEGLHQRQVEAYYRKVLHVPERMCYVPIPLRGAPIPTQEDYDNSKAIFEEVKLMLGLSGIKFTVDPDKFGIRMEK